MTDLERVEIDGHGGQRLVAAAGATFQSVDAFQRRPQIGFNGLDDLGGRRRAGFMPFQALFQVRDGRVHWQRRRR